LVMFGSARRVRKPRTEVTLTPPELFCRRDLRFALIMSNVATGSAARQRCRLPGLEPEALHAGAWRLR
jgi:hypothetical protein